MQEKTITLTGWKAVLVLIVVAGAVVFRVSTARGSTGAETFGMSISCLRHVPCACVYGVDRYRDRLYAIAHRALPVRRG